MKTMKKQNLKQDTTQKVLRSVSGGCHMRKTAKQKALEESLVHSFQRALKDIRTAIRRKRKPYVAWLAVAIDPAAPFDDFTVGCGPLDASRTLRHTFNPVPKKQPKPSAKTKK
jgi:hypothetical protein